jgi:hypothetical protein
MREADVSRSTGPLTLSDQVYMYRGLRITLHASIPDACPATRKQACHPPVLKLTLIAGRFNQVMLDALQLNRFCAADARWALTGAFD